tara:strand:+ start:180 stop:302 length:123 start_codon:yes stop_codon:yes gene_type:complete
MYFEIADDRGGKGAGLDVEETDFIVCEGCGEVLGCGVFDL